MVTTLVGKELASRLQGKLSFVVLTVLVMLFSALLLGAFWMLVVSVPTIVPVIGSSTGTASGTTIQTVVAANRGPFLFYALGICLLATIFTLAPVIASSAISYERENDTLDLLLLSSQRAGSIVFGKLIAAGIFVVLLVTTTIPGFAVAWMFGGVTARDVGIVLMVVLATLVAINAIGLLCSALARNSSVAALYTYAIVYFMSLGSLGLYIIGTALQQEALVRPLLILNPFISLLTIPESLTTIFQQTLPFAFRPGLDPVSQELGGATLKLPRWVLTAAAFGALALVACVLTSVIIDPCHRLRARLSRKPSTE